MHSKNTAFHGLLGSLGMLMGKKGNVFDPTQDHLLRVFQI